MFAALLNGASVFPVEIKERGFAGLREVLKRDEITILTSVTSAFRHFVKSLAQQEYFPTVRLIRLIGEPLYKSDVDAFRKYFSKSCILLNRLGSNETGTFCQYFIDHLTPVMGGVVPVGYPTEGTEVLLLDEEDNEVGDNQVGEFAVRNRHLAIGYWRNPELTQTAFRCDPAGGDRRTYRVGDLGRRLPDGCFVHLGRKDFQVKIRGNRVEIAEVEGALLSCANIREAAVVDREDASGEKILAAYIVPETVPFPTAHEVRRALVEKLPGYMIPTAYVMVDALPVTGTGKVDRRALPEPSDRDIPGSTAEYIRPRNTTERILCQIWSEVFGIDRVGIDDDFFAIGGHSLLAAKLFARLDEQFGRVFPLSILLSASTVRLLAQCYETAIGQINASTLVPLATWGTLPPIYAVPGIFGNVVGMMELSRVLGHPFYSLQSRGLHGKDAPLTSIEAMSSLYIDEIRKVQAHGPYVIIGACFGATVAYEMTRQILERGDEVAFLGLIDPGRRERIVGRMSRFRGPRVVIRARAFGAFLIDRICLYLGEMRRFEKRDQLKFIKGKLTSLLGKATSGRSFDAVQREIDQLTVYHANRFALRRYRRKPLVGRLQALEVFESSHPRNNATGGVKWESLWQGAVIRHKVPGRDSGDTLSGSNAHVLATLLAERIRKAIESPVCRDEEPVAVVRE